MSLWLYTYNDSPNNYIDVGLFVHHVKQPKNLTLVFHLNGYCGSIFNLS